MRGERERGQSHCLFKRCRETEGLGARSRGVARPQRRDRGDVPSINRRGHTIIFVRVIRCVHSPVLALNNRALCCERA